MTDLIPTTPLELFREFACVFYGDERGQRARLARDLGVDKSTVTRLLDGTHGFTPKLALRIELLSGGRYRKECFIWPEETHRAALFAGTMRDPVR